MSLSLLTHNANRNLSLFPSQKRLFVHYKGMAEGTQSSGSVSITNSDCKNDKIEKNISTSAFLFKLFYLTMKVISCGKAIYLL